MLNLIDFDGTLFYTESALVGAYQEAFRAFGIDVPKERLVEARGLSIDSVFKRMEIDDEEIKEGVRRHKKKNYRKYFKEMIPNYNLLKLANKVVVSSAHSQDIQDVLDYFEIKDVLGIVGRDGIKEMKPNPECYLKAAERFPAKKYAIFEDSETGLSSAWSAKKDLEKHATVDIQKVTLKIEALTSGGGGGVVRKMTSKQDNGSSISIIDKIEASLKNGCLKKLDQYGIFVPKIFFLNECKMIMEYIDAPLLYEVYEDKRCFEKLLQLVLQIKAVPFKKDVLCSTYIKRLEEEHKVHFEDDLEILSAFEGCIERLKKHEALLNEEISFCHGDLTLSNLFLKNESLIAIDPNNDETMFSSWLLDVSKLLQSSRNYEYLFEVCNKNNGLEMKKLRKRVLSYLKKDLVEPTLVLELSHFLRMLKYKKKNSKSAFEKARSLTLEIYRELRNIYA